MNILIEFFHYARSNSNVSLFVLSLIRLGILCSNMVDDLIYYSLIYLLYKL